MNQSKDLDNPSFTAYAAGELDGSELADFEAMLGDSAAEAELKETEDMFGLLTDCFADELETNLALRDVDHSLTDYALNELKDEEMDGVETLLDSSPEATAELAGIEEMMTLLSGSLEDEWRAQESVDLDVPAFTDYALGELKGAEADEFAAMLKFSPSAKKELGETEEFISLLSEGLEKEWKSELAESDHEFSLVEATGEENVVSVNFAQESSGSARSAKNLGPVLISLAAVLAGLLVVGGMLSHSETGQNSVVSAAIVGFSSDDHVWVDAGDKSAEVAEAPVESSFNLRLLDELNQPIELAEFDSSPINPYYLGDDSHSSMMNVSLQNDMGNTISHQPTPVRVDSYLPPVKGGHVSYAVQDGLIGGNSARSVLYSDHRRHENGLESVIYQGILTFPEGSGFNLKNLVPFNSDSNEIDLSEDEIATIYSKFQNEIKSIVSELDNPSVDLRMVQKRLNQLLKNHKELGSQVGSD